MGLMPRTHTGTVACIHAMFRCVWASRQWQAATHSRCKCKEQKRKTNAVYVFVWRVCVFLLFFIMVGKGRIYSRMHKHTRVLWPCRFSLRSLFPRFLLLCVYAHKNIKLCGCKPRKTAARSTTYYSVRSEILRATHVVLQDFRRVGKIESGFR